MVLAHLGKELVQGQGQEKIPFSRPAQPGVGGPCKSQRLEINSVVFAPLIDTGTGASAAARPSSINNRRLLSN